MTNEKGAPLAENAPSRSGGPAPSVSGHTDIDAVYTYDSCDLQDMAHPYSGVHVQTPPLGSLVRINLGKDHERVSSAEMNAITRLSYGARRVQIEGQNYNVDYVVRNLRRYLDQQAATDAQVAAPAEDKYQQLWGEPA